MTSADGSEAGTVPDPADAHPGSLPHPGPVAQAGRSLTPDIARGLLLLFIALANVAGFHRGLPVEIPGPDEVSFLGEVPGPDEVSFLGEVPGPDEVSFLGEVPRPDEVSFLGVLDQVVSIFETMFVSDRSRPMFAVLFGFGMAMMAARMAARGVDERGIRRVLRRRSLWLIVFGMVHSVLLFPGDILAPYGVTALITLWLVHRSNRVLHGWFWVSLLHLILVVAELSPAARFALPVSAGRFALPVSAGGAEGATSYPLEMLEGLRSSLSGQVMTVVMAHYVPLMIVGFWLFRSQWLTRPQDHVPQLRRVFAVTMIVNLTLSVPPLLVGVRSPAGAAGWALKTLEYSNLLVGAVAGVGYVCGFALLAVRWADRGRRGLPGVLASVGERSMTAYLLQSVVFFAVLTGWGLGLGNRLGLAGDALVAVVTWALIAVAMARLAHFGVRGPFEVLIRRLTYSALPDRSPAPREAPRI